MILDLYRVKLLRKLPFSERILWKRIENRYLGEIEWYTDIVQFMRQSLEINGKIDEILIGALL